ncbi:protease precursor [Chrysochromulina tobinii]|uniref:Protease n=1 Tax=Chrysochromulina tobinii TaxID=1460289 RepID=A0A0M0J473_9EUKA|nr:protease precursor [Chrysochromulina tobinii]|eukprot:KOO21132.1 protease precursor [Chrysochromulina sp. CCMP291]
MRGATLTTRVRTSRVPSPRALADPAHWQRTLLSSVLAATLTWSSGPLTAHASDLGMAISELQKQEQTVADLFSRARPSVVFITTFVQKTDRMSMSATEVSAGTGSGFVWDDAGHIVTNYHVIRSAEAAKVVLTDENGLQKRFDARLVGYNPDKDVAVLKIDAGLSRPPPISLGSSSSLRVGQTTLAIGNPFGLDHTLTMGVVSGLGREVQSPSGRPITNVIQTDAAINPGNSGGALLDSSGRLIGMNTAIYSPSGASAGIGFAIPVDTLKYQVNTIIKDGKVTRPAIGISYMSYGQARALGVDRGVLVLDVPEQSSADKAGLRGSYRSRSGEIVIGDVITAVNSDVVDDDIELFRAIDKFKPGDRVTLTVSRFDEDDNEQELRIPITLQAMDTA